MGFRRATHIVGKGCNPVDLYLGFLPDIRDWVPDRGNISGDDQTDSVSFLRARPCQLRRTEAIVHKGEEVMAGNLRRVYLFLLLLFVLRPIRKQKKNKKIKRFTESNVL